MKAIIIIVSALMIPCSLHAGIVFDTDFETCTVGTGNDFPCEGWDDLHQERIGAMEVVRGGAFSGSKFMRHFSTGPGNTAGGNTFKPSIYKNIVPSPGEIGLDHMFMRVAIRISTGAQICDNGHTKLIRFRPNQNGAGYPVLWFYWRFGTYQMVMESPYDNPGTGLLGTGFTPRFGQWDQVEVEYKLNTPGQSNGLIRVWINGVPKAEQLNRAYRGPTPTSKCGNGADVCPSNAQIDFAQVYNQCMLGTIDYDRLAIGDTRIGLASGGGGGTGDIQSPTIPTGLGAQAVSSSQINLTWNASTDNVGVTGYRIFRAGTPVGTATATSFSNTGLTASTAYSYTVAAYDAVGNASGQSTAASTTTHAAATGAVGTVSNLSATAAGANSATLSFTEVTDGAGQPAKYDVRFSSSGTLWGGARSVSQGTCTTPLAGTTVGATKTCTVLGLSPSTAYQFQLIAFRGTIGAGAVYGSLSNIAGATTSSAANVIPPAKPRNLRAQ